MDKSGLNKMYNVQKAKLRGSSSMALKDYLHQGR